MLWDDFINSEWRDWRGSGRTEDRLDRPDWLERLLAEHGFDPARPPTEGDIAELKRLRAVLLGIVRRLAAGEVPDAADLGRLNAVMAGGPVVRSVGAADDGRYELRLSPAARDWPQLAAEIAASLVRTMAEGEPSRFRICDNPDCRWVYYDDTRNRSKKYCDDKMCGNLMKVRRFRARKKAGSGAPPPTQPEAE
ncbi:CGNR zinc finger domain-containing protein [Paenibacillus flagellatus]|uniref:Zinc finger CGNR domain-containing protein n=1 Tax=Paenibacillus flagellatus TaxID=2211139 RepID=A0A2V5K3S7_9BACL|nr:CGNR zinc finger domain-containing protein [Paenibacillus flagellatus]PYI53935.1 hypothetical protein DLM86_15385 [Paenibacillus flagellatus]